MIFDMGYDRWLRRGATEENIETTNAYTDGVSPNILLSGGLSGNLEMVDGHIQSSNFVENTTGWQIKYDGTAQFSNITLIGGSINYQKESFTDDAHSGYYIGPEGVYIGSALDATKLKFTLDDGSLDLVGTVSGRSTAILASAINSAGNLSTDVINTKLDTSAKQILDSFTFGASGAICMTTDADNGIWISPTGILGKKDGNNTFSIDTSGNAIFAGELLAASGTLGSITSANIELGDAGYIRTASTGTRIEMEKNMDGGYTHGLVMYGADNNVLFRLAADGGVPSLSIFGNSSVGGVQILNNVTDATFSNLKLTGAGLHNLLELETSGSAARDDYAAIKITNGAIHGAGILFERPADSLNDEIRTWAQRGVTHSNFIRAYQSGSGWNSVQGYRITSEGFLQFPAYHHRSEFEEHSCSLASAPITNAVWVGSGTNGSQVLMATNETKIQLSTSSTANSTSQILFRKAVLDGFPAGLEFRFRVANSTHMENVRWRIGATNESTAYFYIEFDSDVHASKITLKSQNGAENSSTLTDWSINPGIWYIVRFWFAPSNSYKWWVDDDERSDGGSQQVATSGLKPYAYIDNKSTAADKALEIDYFEVWSGRPSSGL